MKKSLKANGLWQVGGMLKITFMLDIIWFNYGGFLGQYLIIVWEFPPLKCLPNFLVLQQVWIKLLYRRLTVFVWGNRKEEKKWDSCIGWLASTGFFLMVSAPIFPKREKHWNGVVIFPEVIQKRYGGI